MALSRRLFLSSALGALMMPRLRQRPRPVCIFLRGGADGLSMVVPYADPAYYRARPTTAIRREAVIDLDERCGLHPALSPLEPYWKAGTLSVLRGTALPGVGSAHAPAQAQVSALLERTDVQLIDSWGWDTHFGQGNSTGPLAGRLRQLARRIDRLAREGRTVFTISEFGRSVHENRIGGTDHAPHVAMLVVARRSFGIVHDPVDMREVVGQLARLQHAV